METNKLTHIKTIPKDFTNIGQVEICEERPKAICLCFPDGVSGLHHRYIWVPKSCYMEAMVGPYKIQAIKTWFMTKECLWDLI